MSRPETFTVYRDEAAVLVEYLPVMVESIRANLPPAQREILLDLHRYLSATFVTDDPGTEG